MVVGKLWLVGRSREKAATMAGGTISLFFCEDSGVVFDLLEPSSVRALSSVGLFPSVAAAVVAGATGVLALGNPIATPRWSACVSSLATATPDVAVSSRF